MPPRDRLPRSPRPRGNRTAVLGALILSLGLHGAAFGAFAWFWDATPAQPIAVFAIELVPGDEVGPQPGSQRTEAMETPPAEAPSVTAQAAQVAEPTATEMAAPLDSRPADPGPPEPARTASSAPAAQPLDVPPPREQHGAQSALAADTSVSEPPPDPARTPAPQATLPAPAAALPEPPPLPLAKPVALKPVPSPAADDDKADTLFAESGKSRTTSPQPPAQGAAEGTGDLSTAPTQVSAATPPRYSGAGLANPAPRYPYLARRRGQEGRVVLRVRVNAEGQAEAVSIRESSGYHLLDEAALETVRQWRFVPAHKADLTVAGLVDVPVSFRLTD